MKERETNQIVFMGKDVIKTDRTSVVTKGTRFKFFRSNTNGRHPGTGVSEENNQKGNKQHKNEVLIARGPLLGPMVVMASSNQINSKYKGSIKFIVSKANDPLSSLSQNEWVIKGWSKCSKECGEGKQHLIVR